MIYEKSHPLDVAVLTRELGSETHVKKIRSKLANGFYGEDVHDTATIASLDEVRLALKEML